MGVQVIMDDIGTILVRRKIQKDGPAQRFMTQEVARLSDPYVPMDAGPLKNTKRVEAHTITYVQPYSKYQWYGVSKKGNPLHYGNGPLRGKMWCKRAMIDHKHDLLQSVANFVGGRTR